MDWQDDMMGCLIGLVMVAAIVFFVIMLGAVIAGLFFGSHNCIYYQCAAQHLSGGLRISQ